MLRFGTFMAVMVALRAFGADDACTGAQTLALQCAVYGTYSAFSCDPAKNPNLIAIGARVSAAAEAKKKATGKDRESLQTACRESLQLNQDYRAALEQFKSACESQRQSCATYCAQARPAIPTCPADAVALTAAVNGSESGCTNLANRVSQASALQAEADRNIALAQSCLASSTATTAPPKLAAFDNASVPAAVAAATASGAPERVAADKIASAATETSGEPSDPSTAIVLDSINEAAPAEHGDEVKTATRKIPVVSAAARATASLPGPPPSDDENHAISAAEKTAKAANENPDLRRFLPGSDLSPDRLSGREEGHKLGLCPRTRGLFECVSERYRSQLDKLISADDEFSK